MTAVIAKLKPGAFKEAKAAGSESSNDASNKRQAGDEDNAPLVASVAKKAKTDNDNDVAACDNEPSNTTAKEPEEVASAKSEVSAGEKEKSTQES